MTLLITSLIRKTTLFLVAATLSVSAMAAELSQIQREANQGDAQAQAFLGAIYAQGEGVRQDYSKSAQWFEKSANQGNAGAQLILGSMYYDGKGVRQDYAVAKEWFGKSCDNGDQDGCDSYRKLNQR